jgi:hypothetical protein
MPQVDVDLCVKTADQCCRYYAEILTTQEKCRLDPYWHEMQGVAEDWRTLLKAIDPTESQFVRLEAQVLAKWGAGHCSSTWIWMATCIDVWLRSRGRAGLGMHPWFKNRAPTTVRPLW